MTPDAKLDRRIAWGLFLGAFVVLLATEKSAGFVRDESQYFAAAKAHAEWFKLALSNPRAALDDSAITRSFDYNHEHPAGMKNLFGLSHWLFHDALKWLRPATALRIPAFLLAALILPLCYLLTRPLFGRGAAVFSALVWLFVPRQFFESHLACFDVPVAAMWLLVVYCFWQALTRPRWWLYTGLAFGGALAAKHNAYFIPLALIPFSLWRGWHASNGKPAARALWLGINGTYVAGAALFAVMAVALGQARFLATFLFPSAQVAVFVTAVGLSAWLLRRLWREDEATFRSVAPLVAMAALGPMLFYLHWPYLWHHPVDRTAWYITFHLTHNHYAWLYLGELLRGPPFPLAYVVVKTALTVPTSLFVPMALGFGWVVVRAARREVTMLEVLIAVNAFISIALISAPTVPHFGGVKHWFPSMPFLAMLAGGSLARGASALQAWLATKGRALAESTVFAALAVLCLVPAFIASVRIYPYGTSAYSELAGGLPGAATLGMQRQFWANNVTGIFEWLNANAKLGDRVYFHENHGGQINDYRENGMVRADLRFVGSPWDADIVAYQYHQEFREHELNAWEAFGTTRPVAGLYVDETPQIVVYRRP
ncbi:MAG: glycosyltransferase family 39 protein [Archangium sp.]|nr:glycosyltransferase family 39 protein [Archangium sp.]